jgi:hypothetical protein
MKPQNIGYRTDCIFHEQNGVIEEKPDYYVIRTPSNPLFWFGNFILFKNSPCNEDYLTWMDIHQSEFGETLAHVTFGWDSENQGTVDEFQHNGFNLVDDVVLRMRKYKAIARINRDIEIRKISNDRDWAAVTALQVKVDTEDMGFGDEDKGAFRKSQEIAFRKMIEIGLGDWWGAFLGDELISSMGLFFDRDLTIGRFQNVATASKHRGKGACTTVLDYASRNAFEVVGVKELAINTGDDESNPAKHVYQAIGFRDGIKSYGLTLSKPHLQELNSDTSTDIPLS